jgi:membrane protein YqaA with SNARE-associated domain
MNAPYIHLIFSHLPVTGVPISLMIFLIAYIKRSHQIFIAGCWVLLIVSLGAVPTYWAGEPAEEIVKHLPHFNEQVFERHEAWGQYALMSTLLSGFLALVCLFYDSFRKTIIKPLIVATIVWVTVNAAILLMTANYGGKVNHQEIRSGAVTYQESED